MTVKYSNETFTKRSFGNIELYENDESKYLDSSIYQPERTVKLKILLNSFKSIKILKVIRSYPKSKKKLLIRKN